jgi:hypothetical protein
MQTFGKENDYITPGSDWRNFVDNVVSPGGMVILTGCGVGPNNLEYLQTLANDGNVTVRSYIGPATQLGNVYLSTDFFNDATWVTVSPKTPIIQGRNGGDIQ